MVFDWSHAQVLLALARHGSVRAAAEALGVNGTTVVRRLDAFEATLGAALFVRYGRGWQLTSAGARVLPLAQAMELDAASLTRAAAAEQAALRGVVRLTAPEALTSEFLPPLLATVRAKFPQVALEVSATNRVVSLARLEADLALRLNRPTEPTLVARRLARVSNALAASREYLEARGVPTRRTLEEHDLVWDTAALDDSVEGRWRRAHAPRARLVLRSDSPHTRCGAALAGLGVTFLPRYLVETRPGLARVEGLPQLPTRELWLVVHREGKRQAPVRAVADTLAALVVEARASLEERH